MDEVKVTLLGYILLGLLRKQPQSGYAVQRLFAATPLMNYSDSPGAIYPALRRLEAGRLIEEQPGKKGGERPRRVYRLTAEGLARLRGWLSEPITVTEIGRDVGLLMVRFSLMDAALGQKRSLQFLEEAEPQLAAHASGLRVFFRERSPGMPLSSRLALDFGVRSYDTLLRWTRDAIAAYAKPARSHRSK